MKIRSVLQKVLCIAACTAVSSVVAQTVEKPIPPIHTEGGQLAGKVLASGVKAWLGVPYAKPPVDDLRWRPPQPFSWKGVWNADRTMSECLQFERMHETNQYFGEEPAAENCLYMNIWAPANATAGAKLPVIVYIHGGGFTIGSSGMPLYGGEHVAQHGAIFVNFNYRLGILGFMAHPELTKEQGGHSGDYGFLDQNAALKWVHDNIAKFGGDPSQVLLMGQSAGAGSVTEQVFSPLSKGLFRAAVMSSGCNWAAAGPIRTTTLAQGEELGLQIQKLLHAANLDEMRHVASDRILGLYGTGADHSHGVTAGPITDGYFMPKSQLEILQAHEINDVPIIASSNGDEMDSAQYPLTTARTVAEYKDIAQKVYGDKADEFLALYPVSSDADVSAMAHRAAEDAGLQESSRHCAQIQAEYDKSPAYIDLFTHRQPFTPGVKIADLDSATVGAYHTGDNPYFFGTLDPFNMFRSTRIWQPWDHELSEAMMATLVAMAKTGSPATAAVKWPAWSATDEQRVVFGDKIAIEKLDTKGMDWLAAHPAAPVAIPAASAPKAHD